MKRLAKLRDVLIRSTAQSAPARYAVAAGVALVMLSVRGLFDPVLGPGAYYFLYVPVVVVVAYALGFGPAVLAILVAGVTSYFVFSRAGFGFKADAQTNLRLVLFVVSAVIAAWMASRVRARLAALEAGASAATAQARSQADLFREFAERVSSHLQLLSVVLQIRARDETAPDYARVLMNAASRTMMISRLNRSTGAGEEGLVDFAAFAERLADSALEAHGRPPLVISVEGELVLLPEHAVSLALMVLECVNARAREPAPGHLRIVLSSEGDDGVLVIAEDRVLPSAAPSPEANGLIGALATQLGGKLVLGRSGAREQFRFAFPTTLQPLPAWDPLQVLH